MAKKGFLVLVLAALVAGGAFAQINFSVGGGGFIGGDFGGGIEFSAGGMEMTMEMPYFGGGGYVFFDATYAELSLGFFGGSGKFKTTQSMSGSSISNEVDFSITSFNIGLLGKYPFAVNDSLTVFPLLGIDYQIVLSAKLDGENYKSDGEEAPGDFSALWFKLGGGIDYSFTGNIFLRAEALYGIRLANKMENDVVDMYKEGASGIDVKPRLGHGLTFNLAIGYRF